MTKDKLIIEDNRGEYNIAWWLAEDEDIGGRLGEGGRKPHKATCETSAAEIAVWNSATGMSGGQLYWESKKEAQVALALAKRAVAEFEGAKPWPEWAKQAQANGWKPPKGWTP